MSRAVTAASVLLVAACTDGRRTTVEPKPGGGVTVRNGGIGWGTKVILTKHPPETVIAEDGTVCRVAADRYKDSAVGRPFACDWQPGNPVDSPPGT